MTLPCLRKAQHAKEVEKPSEMKLDANFSLRYSKNEK
jgi:hypothetical protein